MGYAVILVSCHWHAIDWCSIVGGLRLVLLRVGTEAKTGTKSHYVKQTGRKESTGSSASNISKFVTNGGVTMVSERDSECEILQSVMAARGCLNLSGNESMSTTHPLFWTAVRTVRISSMVGT